MRYQKKKNWKYKVYEDCRFKLGFNCPTVNHKYFSIYRDEMIVKKDYTYDGASGAIDTENFMVPSLKHDIFYQCIRCGLLDEIWKKDADLELKKDCLERGMSKFRAWYVYFAVNKFGGSSIKSDIIEVK
ncbi:MAG: hypothetical protein H8D45_05640 [Bacteroidetes bacterium]|nr:hypothetical protein [Bacteroidota bacterium]